mgnify:CR=1 FL=1
MSGIALYLLFGNTVRRSQFTDLGCCEDPLRNLIGEVLLQQRIKNMNRFLRSSITITAFFVSLRN